MAAVDAEVGRGGGAPHWEVGGLEDSQLGERRGRGGW